MGWLGGKINVVGVFSNVDTSFMSVGIYNGQCNYTQDTLDVILTPLFDTKATLSKVKAMQLYHTIMGL